jgi:beta-lactamase class A
MIAATGAVALTGCSGAEKAGKAAQFAAAMVDLQKRHGGRIGISAVSGTERLNINSDQRFAMCSTFKWVLAAAVLQQADQARLELTQGVTLTQKDILSYAPVTSKHVADGSMTVADLCSAAVTLSDNTAANLLYPLVGGPSGLTTFVRQLGDTVTQFDRMEPELNTNVDGDPRDTSTPAAMTALLQMVYGGTVLRPESLAQLQAWMVQCSTGAKRIRASVPADWSAGDKTGTGENKATNDVAVLWPPNNKPAIYLTVFTSGGGLDDDGRNAIIAEAAKAVIDALA